MPFPHVVIPFLHVPIGKLFYSMPVLLISDLKPIVCVFPCSPGRGAFAVFVPVPEHASELRPILVHHFASAVLEPVHPLADVGVPVFVGQNPVPVLVAIPQLTCVLRPIVLDNSALA